MANNAFRSLVPFGLDVVDDDDLRWFFTCTIDESNPSEFLRASRVQRILGCMLKHGEWELQHVFFARRPELHTMSTLTAVGYASEAAIDEYERVTGLALPPSGDGERTIKWLEDGAAGKLYFEWLAKLDSGMGTPREAKALERIHNDSRQRLESMVRSFLGAKEWLVREEKRDQRERDRPERRSRSMVPQNFERPRRRYGQLPVQPEIIVQRRRPPPT